MENCCQIRVLKKPLLNYWYIFTHMYNYVNFIFIVIVTSFNFETQLVHMRSLKLFKVSEILRVATFNIICSATFASNCVDHSCQHPFEVKDFGCCSIALEYKDS